MKTKRNWKSEVISILKDNKLNGKHNVGTYCLSYLYASLKLEDVVKELNEFLNDPKLVIYIKSNILVLEDATI